MDHSIKKFRYTILQEKIFDNKKQVHRELSSNYTSFESFTISFQKVIVSLIIDDTENDPALDPYEIIFIQDKVPPHFAYLSDKFFSYWIGQEGEFMESPARSLDLTPFDFFYKDI